MKEGRKIKGGRLSSETLSNRPPPPAPNKKPKDNCPKCEAQAAEIEKLHDVLAAIKDMKWDTLTQGCNVASKAQAMARKALEQST